MLPYFELKQLPEVFSVHLCLKELVSQKAEPRNRSEQEIAGYREVLATIHESYEYTSSFKRLSLVNIPSIRLDAPVL